jgi:methionyl aminopeptidase
MLRLKSPRDIALMRASGLLTWQAHQVAAALVRPGVTTAEIDAAVEAFYLSHGATPLFKGVPGVVPFPATACISVNAAVVHGIPSGYRLREGDIVSIDLGCRLDGWCSDAATTYGVGTISPRNQQLLHTTEEALRCALKAMRTATRWSQVARQIEAFVRDNGFCVVKSTYGLSGHGIGRELWEDPSVPNSVSATFERQEDFPLKPGLVIAVEPMVTQTSSAVHQLADHWTIVSNDGLPSAHFEHTIAITHEGPQVLTCGPDGQGWAL